MAEGRRKIGLLFSYDENWIGGAYYIMNLIHALGTLPDLQKPSLYILTKSREEFNKVKESQYPYLFFRKFDRHKSLDNYFMRLINKVGRELFGKPLIESRSIKLDILFPAVHHSYFRKIESKIYWIPDFQEHFLPNFFSDTEIINRKKSQSNIVANKYPVIFSSNNSLAHFMEIFPGADQKAMVVQFAVTHPQFNHVSFEDLKTRYNIDQEYFFCANQFWAHKNHISVLEAIRIIRSEKKRNILVVFSGKESDYRNPDFFKSIKETVFKYGIQDSVRFLGFIPREEQLQLMANSRGIIQPSLFEGWSTVIEDGKRMNQFIIASSIDVHKEQLLDYSNSILFEPTNSLELADKLLKYAEIPPHKFEYGYDARVRKFAFDFMNAIE